MSRSRSIIAASILLLSLTQTASAMTEQTFTFGAGELNATWKGHGGVQVSQEQDGLNVVATSPGLLNATVDLDPLPQAGVLITSSAEPVDLEFVWNDFTNANQDQVYRLPVSIPAGDHVQTPLLLSSYKDWSNVTLIGFSFPKSASIKIHTLGFFRLNFAERMWERVRSFWAFDDFRPYGINFVWGPMVSDNPVARLYLYNSLPPHATSGTQSIYIIIAVVLAAITAFILYRRGLGGVRRLWKPFAVVILCGWLLLDARMGAEYLSWVWHDMASYSTARPGTRTFRDRDRFYDFADFAAPLVADRKSYVFFAPREWPFLGNIRYLTYPSIPGNATNKDDTWVIYNRPDMLINDAGQLTQDGQALTQPGLVIGRFSPDSFVFRVSPTR